MDPDPALMKKMGFSEEDIALMLSKSDDDDSDTEACDMRLPSGLVRHDASALTSSEAMQIYQRDQLLWLRLDSVADTECCARFGLQSLTTLPVCLAFLRLVRESARGRWWIVSPSP